MLSQMFNLRLMLCINILITFAILTRMLKIRVYFEKEVNTAFIVQNNNNNNNAEDVDELLFGDNQLGFAMNIVPNIIHYVLFDINQIDFAHYISILSVLRHHKPQQIMIHCNCDQIVGEYWQQINNKAKAMATKVTLNTVNKVTQIYGKALSKKWINWHSSDITRLKVLMKYGGIYLDRDVYVVNSLDKYRNYEMTVNWDEGQSIGNQVLIAHKNARFLNLYLDTYRSYDETKWYYNGGVLPTNSILKFHPQLVHRVKVRFGVDGPVVCPFIFSFNGANWTQEYDTLHMYMRGNLMAHKECLRRHKAPLLSFDEQNIKTLNVTFGQMARLVLYGTTDLINN